MWCEGSYYSSWTMNNQPNDCKLTPRTDTEEQKQTQRYGCFMVKSDFARTLERELNEANARIKELEDELARVADELHAERERD